MRQSYLILSNAAIMWTARVLLFIPQIVLVPFLIRTLGESGYGIYVLAWSLLMAIEQLEMSLQQGVVKYSSSFFAVGRIDELNKVISSSFIFSLILAVIASTGVLIASIYYQDPTGQIGSALLIIGVLILFIVPLTPYIAVIQSQQRYYVGAIADTVSKYISLALIMGYFLLVGPSIEALLVIMAGMLFLSKLCQVPIAYRLVPGLKNRFNMFSYSHFVQILTFGSMIVLISLSLVINSTGIRWLAGALESTSFVAHVAIILMPGELLSTVVLAMTLTLMPASSAFHASDNWVMLSKLLRKSMKYTIILLFGILLAAVFLLEDIILLWLGSDYLFLYPYVILSLIGKVFLLSTSPMNQMLKGLGKLNVIIVASFLGLVLVPLISIMIFYNLIENAYTTIVASLSFGYTIQFVTLISYGAKTFQIDARELLGYAYKKTLILALLTYLCVAGIYKLFNIDNIYLNITISSLSVIFFFYVCFRLSFNQTEREQAKEVVTVAFGKVMPFKSFR